MLDGTRTLTLLGPSCSERGAGWQGGLISMFNAQYTHLFLTRMLNCIRLQSHGRGFFDVPRGLLLNIASYLYGWGKVL